MAEQKYLDKAGLQVLWDAAKAKFIDNDELASALSQYEKIEDLVRDYYNKSEVNALINALADVYATKVELSNGLATKTDKQVNGTNGTAYIFNETDGGGAKFVHTDGSEAFVGVNDGGKNGLMAQIYADQLVGGKWQGAKLDVTNGAIYYTVGDKSFADRAISDNELVVKKDIKDLAGGMHFIGATVLQSGESIEQAIARIYASKGKSYADKKAGDIVIIKTADSDKEFIYDGSSWVELGDQGVYATKTELAAEASSRQDADAILETAIESEVEARQEAVSAEETRAKAEEAKKADLPGQCPAWLNPTGQTPYPWFMASLDVESTGLGPDAAGNLRVNVGAYNFNQKAYYKWEKSLPFAATNSKAGLMIATDKAKLDDIQTMTQAEIEEICK